MPRRADNPGQEGDDITKWEDITISDWEDLVAWYDQPDRYLFKELPNLAMKNLSLAYEAQYASQSLYAVWWYYLAANREEYNRASTGSVDQERQDFYAKFGKLDCNFQAWWFKRGRDLFAERGHVPIIKVLGKEPSPDGSKYPVSLTVEIPLTISRELLHSQLDSILAMYHRGPSFRRHQFSQARCSLFPRARYNAAHYMQLLRVWEKRKRHPEKEFWQIGRELRVRKSSDSRPESEQRRDLQTQTRRLFMQAEAMMYNAMRGRFPYDELPPNYQPESPEF